MYVAYQLADSGVYVFIAPAGRCPGASMVRAVRRLYGMRNWRVFPSAVCVAAPMVLGSHQLAWQSEPTTDDSLENFITGGVILILFVILTGPYAAFASIVSVVALKWQRV